MCSASSAYSEQLGSNRQRAIGPKMKILAGDNIERYIRTAVMRMNWAKFTI